MRRILWIQNFNQFSQFCFLLLFCFQFSQFCINYRYSTHDKNEMYWLDIKV